MSFPHRTERPTTPDETVDPHALLLRAARRHYWTTYSHPIRNITHSAVDDRGRVHLHDPNGIVVCFEARQLSATAWAFCACSPL